MAPMAYNFRTGDRDQQFLLPPSVADWLPEGHLAWFVLDTVAQLNLDAFYLRYRDDGRGGAAYEPAAMVGVVIYAYCVGDRSSRLIERRLVEDVAYRVVAANAAPDHATIARFRATHEGALGELFAQVLGLCAAAGLVRVGLVALDGTKVEANATGSANMDDERLARAIAAEVAAILAEAAAIDEAEDALYGDARGDELPPELAERSSRLRRLREAKARLDAAAAERGAAGQGDPSTPGDAGAKKKKKKPARPTPPGQQRLLINATDPDSRPQKVAGGFCQGYNAQAAATVDQVVVAAEVMTVGVDVVCLEPMLDAARTNLDAVGVGAAIETLVADAGYWSAANAGLDTDTELLIATCRRAKQPTTGAPPPLDLGADADRAEAARAAAQAATFDRVATGELTMRQAAAVIGLTLPRTYVVARRYRELGVDALVRRRRPDAPRPPSPTAATVARQAMETRLADPAARALYRRRAAIIEPVFGQIKAGRSIRRFQRRGLAACASEWKLIAATHNLLKLWRHVAVAPALAA
jgi:transposase